MTPAERAVVEAARALTAAIDELDICPHMPSQDRLEAALDALDATPPAPRVTAGEAWPERCLWCGSDGSFFRFCDGVCVPCSDKMQEMPKADLIRALARAVRDAQRLRRLETEPTP